MIHPEPAKSLKSWGGKGWTALGMVLGAGINEEERREMKKTLEQLREDFNAARTALRDAEEKEAREQAAPKLMALVGTYWRYRNSYSCPGPNDYWWAYRRVDGVRGLDLVMTEFQIDKDGELRGSAKKASFTAGGEMNAGWKKCTKSQWKRNLLRVRRMVK